MQSLVIPLKFFFFHFAVALIQNTVRWCQGYNLNGFQAGNIFEFLADRGE